MKTDSLISANELLELINNQDSKLLIVDARAGKDAYKRYIVNHLQNAIFVDLENDLSNPEKNAAIGGRHPLPSLEDFSKSLGKLGINEDNKIVVYDDKNGALAAARFWWLMLSVGHKWIKVLNGGLIEAVEAGIPTSNQHVFLEPTRYDLKYWNLPTVDKTSVKKASEEKNFTIIDVRENSRYKGISEPIDKIAGHIPNAINIPFAENLNEDGRFKSAEELKNKYENIIANNPQNVIVHCGSGVTACHTLLAMDIAGLPIPNLYVGSWSEWSSSGEKIATEV